VKATGLVYSNLSGTTHVRSDHMAQLREVHDAPIFIHLREMYNLQSISYIAIILYCTAA